MMERSLKWKGKKWSIFHFQVGRGDGVSKRIQSRFEEGACRHEKISFRPEIVTTSYNTIFSDPCLPPFHGWHQGSFAWPVVTALDLDLDLVSNPSNVQWTLNPLNPCSTVRSTFSGKKSNTTLPRSPSRPDSSRSQTELPPRSIIVCHSSAAAITPDNSVIPTSAWRKWPHPTSTVRRNKTMACSIRCRLHHQ